MFFAINTFTMTDEAAITWMPVLFYAPWAIFCTLSGYLADRFSKRHSLVLWKVIEVAITLLAGLQTISTDLHEAASLDGANGWRRFWHVTWPLLKPVTVVVVVFSIIQTFSDFQLIYVLTGGGPANATHLLATYAYQIGIATGLLGEGAAISLFMLPVLFIVVWLQLRYLRRLEGV